MRFFREVLFWVVSATVLVLVFGKAYGGYANSFYFVMFLMPVIIGTSYTFSEFLLPRYLLKKRYLHFGLYTFYTIIISLNLEMLVITMAFSIQAQYHYEYLVPAARNVFVLAITIYFIALLKAFTRLFQKTMADHRALAELHQKQRLMEKGYILVRANRKDAKIPLENITWIESLADYVKIHLHNGPAVITKEKISHIGSRLPGHFVRIHRSFIVNSDAVSFISSEYVEVGDKKLPVSRTYKKAVQQHLKKS